MGRAAMRPHAVRRATTGTAYRRTRPTAWTRPAPPSRHDRPGADRIRIGYTGGYGRRRAIRRPSRLRVASQSPSAPTDPTDDPTMTATDDPPSDDRPSLDDGRYDDSRWRTGRRSRAGRRRGDHGPANAAGRSKPAGGDRRSGVVLGGAVARRRCSCGGRRSSPWWPSRSASASGSWSGRSGRSGANPPLMPAARRRRCMIGPGLVRPGRRAHVRAARDGAGGRWSGGSPTAPAATGATSPPATLVAVYVPFLGRVRGAAGRPGRTATCGCWSRWSAWCCPTPAGTSPGCSSASTRWPRR